MKTGEKERGSLMLVLAALCWVPGWGAAVAYGHGFEMQRMVVAIPGIVLAGLLVLPAVWRRGGGWTPGVLLVGVATIYFAIRAAYSPVWDLGRMDLLLICLGGVSLGVGTCVADSPRAIRVLIGGLVLLFALNLSVAAIQGTSDPGYAFLRGSREGHPGVSGLFWHRNYLAGMLELMVPVFLALALSGDRTFPRIGFGILVAAGVGLAYCSLSRAGLISVGVGCAVVFFVWLMRGWHGWSKNARVAAPLVGIGVVVLLIGGMLALASQVSDKRGQGKSLEGAIGKSNARLAFAGLAFDQWQESPLLGTGARTFSYLSVRNWDQERTENSMGNPEMVHSDYLQTLAEYGVLGLVLVVIVVGAGVVRGVEGVWNRGTGGRCAVAGFQLGAIGGICAAMVHSGVDFTLHILPHTLLFGLFLGTVLSGGRSWGRALTGEGESREGMGGGLGIIRGTAVSAGLVLLVMCSFVAGGRELMILPDWFRFEQGVIASGVTPSRKENLREMIEKAPDFELARYHGRITLEQMLLRPDQREALVAEGLWAMRLAVTRHPFDAESHLNLARVLEAGGRDEEAAREYLIGIELTWRRENKYGAMMAFSDHLGRRGEESYLARKPGVALVYYQRAREYLDRSWKAGFRTDVWRFSHPEYLAKMKYLEERIDFLEGAGIKADSSAVEIPAPPVE